MDLTQVQPNPCMYEALDLIPAHRVQMSRHGCLDIYIKKTNKQMNDTSNAMPG